MKTKPKTLKQAIISADAVYTIVSTDRKTHSIQISKKAALQLVSEDPEGFSAKLWHEENKANHSMEILPFGRYSKHQIFYGMQNRWG